jgi:SPP1 family predicted phage head-tail adaptor
MPTLIATSAGDLRERVSFQRRTTADDGFGNTVTGDWGDLWCCAARIMPLRGGENIVARRLSGVQPVAITVRVAAALCDLTTDDRIVDARKGTIYNIRSIANFDEHRQYLEILAEAGVAT